MNLMPFVIVWLILAAVLVVLLIYRASLSRREQETVHVLGTDPAEISHKMTVAQKLLVVERWLKIVAVILVVYSLVLLGLFLWDAWERSSRGAI